MAEEEQTISLEQSYYQILSVPRTATLDEITSAYRRFSRLFHPDKHQNGTNRKMWAEVAFNKIKVAYEVLSDPHKRAIYDILGKKGLEVEGWEVILRQRPPEEIREEYERLKREREEKRLNQSVDLSGTITLSIDATDIFTKYRDEYDLSEDTSIIPNIEISSITIQQSVNTPVTLQNSISVSGDVSTQNGTGAGSLRLSNRHWTTDRGFIETQCGIGKKPLFGLLINRTLSKLMFLNCGTSLEFTSRGIVPSFMLLIGKQLDSCSAGYITYKIDGKVGSGMSSTFIRESEKYHLNTAVQVGRLHSFISIDYTRKMLEYEMKFKLSLKIGTFGAIAEYGLEKKVSPSSSLAATVSVGVPTGVTLNLKWTCLSQSIVVPIRLCEGLIPAPILYATMVPVMSWLLIKSLIIDPIKAERLEREREAAVEELSEGLQDLRQEAFAMIELMKDTYMKIRNEEQRTKGLYIIRAMYGKLPEDETDHLISDEESGDGDSAEAMDSEVLNVTIPVQCLVKDHSLQLFEGTKTALPGFYDTCIGEEKHLTIFYSYNDIFHFCTVADNEACVLPMNNHRIYSSP